MASDVFGQLGTEPASVAGIISTPMVVPKGMGPQDIKLRVDTPVVVRPAPKFPHPGVSTSCIIGHTEDVVNAQFLSTFPKIGTPVQKPVGVDTVIKSMATTSEVMVGLFMPQGSAGGAKLCK